MQNGVAARQHMLKAWSWEQAYRALEENLYRVIKKTQYMHNSIQCVKELVAMLQEQRLHLKLVKYVEVKLMNTYYSKSNNEQIDLSIIIVGWNSWSYLQKCVMSIKENAGELKYE